MEHVHPGAADTSVSALLGADFEDRPARLMRRMGYPATETGPYVTELRAWVNQKCAEGMQNISGGTWAPGAAGLSYEERARQTLAFMWSANLYAYSVKSLDGPPWRYVTDVQTMRRRLVIHWGRAPAWLSDVLRASAIRLRRLWDRKVRRVENPYLATALALTDNGSSELAGYAETADSIWGLAPREYVAGDARHFKVRLRRGEGWDVKPEAEAMDGKTLRFTFGWIAEPEERYAGERVWIAPLGSPVHWLAEGDLVTEGFWP
jgi:hypothetical protein